MKKESLLSMIGSMHQNLSMPVSEDEISNGWNDDIKSRVADYFASVHKDVAQGEEVEHVGIVRSLDFDGVCKGNLVCEIAQLMQLIIKYNEEL